MTADLASRLRASATQARAIDRAALLEEAAAEIERLRAVTEPMPIVASGIGSVTLTDAEREAVAWAATHLKNCGWGSAALRSLLERLSNPPTKPRP